MNKENFRSYLNNSIKIEKKYEELFKEFNKQMPEALTSLAFKHLPKLLYKEEKNNIFSITQKYTEEIWEKFNMADWMSQNKDEVTPFKIPKLKTKEEEEIKLQNELSTIPKEYHKEYRKLSQNTNNEIKEHNAFILDCHNIMKKVFTKIYLDDILSLEANYLRYFDGNLYILADNFVQEVYEYSFQNH